MAESNATWWDDDDWDEDMPDDWDGEDLEDVEVLRDAETEAELDDWILNRITSYGIIKGKGL